MIGIQNKYLFGNLREKLNRYFLIGIQNKNLFGNLREKLSLVLVKLYHKFMFPMYFSKNYLPSECFQNSALTKFDAEIHFFLFKDFLQL